jgi:hypothetical protein
MPVAAGERGELGIASCPVITSAGRAKSKVQITEFPARQDWSHSLRLFLALPLPIFFSLSAPVPMDVFFLVIQ